MKKVLIITFYFPPATAAAIHRIVKFVRYLPGFGWEPIILTVKKKYYDEKRLAYDSTSDVPNNLHVYRTSMLGWVVNLLKARSYSSKMKRVETEKRNYTSKAKSNSKIKTFLKLLKKILIIPDDKIWWVPAAIPKALLVNLSNSFDVIYTTGGPFSTHLIGFYLKKLLDKPWIADFRDPWFSNPIVKWDFEIVKNLVMKMEKKVLINADLVIANTKALKEDFEKKYPYLPPERFFTITNGYDPEDFKNIDKASYEKFTITYTGVLYDFHSLTPFLEGIKRLFEREKELYKKIQVLVFGPFLPVHEKEIEDFGLKEIIHLKGPKPHKEIIRYIISSHLLLVTLTTNEGKSLFIPGKVFEYLGSGRPILSISPEGELAELIRNNTAGRVVNPRDIDGISKAIELFYEEFVSGNVFKEKRENIEEYNAKNLTFKLSEQLNKLFMGKRL